MHKLNKSSVEISDDMMNSLLKYWGSFYKRDEDPTIAWVPLLSEDQLDFIAKNAINFLEKPGKDHQNLLNNIDL
ncbi:MAG: hypothetical protein P1U74_07150 [Legionellaceae bacterium]|nr:hypothetical protein [Legionellaceae bacterium]